MAQSKELAKTGSGSHTSPQVQTVHQTLDRLGQTIADRRRTLAHQASGSRQTEGDWEEMVRTHQALQLEVESTGTMADQLIEGLRFDLDILKHAFRRWVFRVDRSF